MSGLVDRLPLANKLLYASDMIGSQAIAQTRNLWLLFFLAPPRAENLPAAVPALSLGFVELDPRVSNFVFVNQNATNRNVPKITHPLCCDVEFVFHRRILHQSSISRYVKN